MAPEGLTGGPFPLLFAFPALESEPQGDPAYRPDDLPRRDADHTLPVGTLAAFRGPGREPGEEILVEVAAVAEQQWPGDMWVYYVRPVVGEAVRIADLAAAVGCDPVDLIG